MKPIDLLISINRFFFPRSKKYKKAFISGNIGISEKEFVKECLSRCEELWVFVEDSRDGIEASRRIREAYSIEGVDRVLMYRREKDLLFLIKAISPDVRFLKSEFKGKNYIASQSNIPVHYLDF